MALSELSPGGVVNGLTVPHYEQFGLLCWPTFVLSGQKPCLNPQIVHAFHKQNKGDTHIATLILINILTLYGGWV